MSGLSALKETVVQGLSSYLEIPVVRNNQTGEQTAYPYCSYSIPSLLEDKGGAWEQFDDGYDRKPATQTWTVTLRSDDIDEATALAVKARNWLDHLGTVYLSDNGVTVLSVAEIVSADGAEGNTEEFQYSFDVVFWFLNEVQSATEETGYIEEAEIGGISFRRNQF